MWLARKLSLPKHGSPFWVIATILVINLICMTAFAALGLLVTIRMADMGYSNTRLGWQVIMWSIGVMALGRFFPPIIFRLGVLGSLYLGLLGCAGLISTLTIIPMGPWWLVEAFLSGGVFGLFWTVSETWLSAVSPEAYRSRINALYAMTIGVAGSGGSLLLHLIGDQGMWPFWTLSLIIAGSSLCLLVVRHYPTQIALHGRSNIWRTAKTAGLVLVIGVVSGFTDAGTSAMFSVYVLKTGYSESELLRMVFVFGLGRLILQMPVGMIADRLNRVTVLCTSSFLCVIVVLSLPWALNTPFEAPVLFLWGGLIDTFYVLGLAIMGSRYSGQRLVEMNALFVMLYSLGTATGAPSLGFMMDQFGANVYPIVVAAVIGVAICASLLSTTSFFQKARHK
ncbi:MAG: MFS transporter [Candidatus Symbiobacter sp.]|nr:MFS transporter [Candidatus Symbiobacter sp.]